MLFSALLSSLLLLLLTIPASAEEPAATATEVVADAEQAVDEQTGPRTAEAILAAYDGLEQPEFDRERYEQEQQEYLVQFMEARHQVQQQQALLAKELLEIAPEHPRMVALLVSRWQALLQDGEFPQAMEEIDQWLSQHEQSEHRADVLYTKATLLSYQGESQALLQAAQTFIEENPADPRGARLLMRLAENQPPAEKLATLERIVRDYADTESATMAAGKLRQIQGIGKPFELAFEDAITGKHVAIPDLKGKVVVIDFWATWCGPCVAEMPHLKELYAQYQEHGLEIIGVSLDSSEQEGGLEELKAFVEEQEIRWPQYYEGGGWENEFASSWGISGIPTLFVVDPAGNLHTVDGRGQLDQLIPQLLGLPEPPGMLEKALSQLRELHEKSEAAAKAAPTADEGGSSDEG